MVASDGDACMHWRVGEYMLETKQVIRTDVFSHTMPGAPIRKIRQAEPFEVIEAGVKPEGDAADLSDDDLPLLRTHMMN